MSPSNYSMPSRIPSKVLILFVSFFLFVTGLYYLTQSTYKSLLISVNELSKPDELANMSNELLFEISQANLAFQSYTISGKPSHLQEYFKYNKTITEAINLLKIQIQDHPQVVTNIDTLELLWCKKDEQITEIMELIGSDREIVINPLAMSNSRIITDTVIKQIYISFIPVFSEDTAAPETIIVPEEKKGLKQWFKSIFKGRKSEVDTKLNEPVLMSSNASFKIVTDTIVTKSRKIEIADSSNWLSMVSKYKNQNLSKRKLQKELIDLIQNDAKISQELEKIGLSLRDQIYNQLQKEKLHAKSTVGQSLDWMKYASLATFGVCFLFVIIIINDILKGEYYRNKLEKANTTIHNSALQKEKFLYSVSHELRTPLTAILGFAEQIDQMEVKPKVKQYNHIIVNAANHLLETVNEVLDIAKIESGKLVLNRQPMHLPTFLGSLTELFKMEAEEKGIFFKIDMSKVKHEYINMDAFRLKQILINLISNALKFTDKGRVEVFFSQKNKNWLHIEVIDTGKGINGSKLSQIFEEYVQADKNDWLKYKGTGLGLTITKKIVDAMDGKINVQSQEGKGSTFTVDIPYLVAEKPKHNNGNPIKREQMLFSGKNILSVEDDTFSGLLIHTILSNQGAHVTLVSDGKEALEKLKKEPYDLVVTDMQIPKITGGELVAFMKENNISCPVLIVSATPTQLKYQVPTFLKPFKEHDFVSKVAEVLQINVEAGALIQETHVSLEEDQKTFIEMYIKELKEALEGDENQSKQVHEVNHKLIPFLIYHKHEIMVPRLKQLETLIELNAEETRIDAFANQILAELEMLSH